MDYKQATLYVKCLIQNVINKSCSLLESSIFKLLPCVGYNLHSMMGRSYPYDTLIAPGTNARALPLLISRGRSDAPKESTNSRVREPPQQREKNDISDTVNYLLP